jgi:hypothetical protein
MKRYEGIAASLASFHPIGKEPASQLLRQREDADGTPKRFQVMIGEEPMKALAILNLSAALLGLGIVLASANEQPEGQCIKLWPERGTTDAARPSAATLQKTTNEVLTGAAAHVLAYVESNGGAGFDPDPKQLFIFPTTGGRYVIRIRDLPPGLGLHGPF